MNWSFRASKVLTLPLSIRSIQVLGVAVACAIGGFASCEAQENRSIADHPAIRTAGFIYESAPFPSCHASTIEETPSGLISAWFGGTHEKHPDVGIWVSMFRSGKWTEPVEVVDGQGAGPNGTELPTWNPVLFQPKKSSQGTSAPLILFYKLGPSPETWWGMEVRSQDHGKTWSKPARLPEGFLGPIKNKPLELNNGDWLCPTSTETEEEPSKWQVYFERFSIGSQKWTKTQPLNDGVQIQAIQPTLLDLGGGKYKSIGRSRQNKIFETISTDNGLTWAPLSLGSLPNNNSGLDALTLKDGRHLVVYNHIGGTPGQWGGKRTPLNVAISKDSSTWESSVVLENTAGEFSYPAVIQSGDGLIHITYTWNRKKIKHVVLDPTKL
ncbi:MAG: glycoside hydrolase [Planctomycetes bacterium]|nr:glycoside hydrolase [Planctomycetota bacterium]